MSELSIARIRGLHKCSLLICVSEHVKNYRPGSILWYLLWSKSSSVDSLKPVCPISWSTPVKYDWKYEKKDALFSHKVISPFLPLTHTHTYTLTHLSLTQTLKQDIMASAAFSSISPGLALPIGTCSFSAWGEGRGGRVDTEGTNSLWEQTDVGLTQPS